MIELTVTQFAWAVGLLGFGVGVLLMVIIYYIDSMDVSEK